MCSKVLDKPHKQDTLKKKKNGIENTLENPEKSCPDSSSEDLRFLGRNVAISFTVKLFIVLVRLVTG